MLIRTEQMNAFHAVMDKAFAERAAFQIHHLFPKHTAFMGAGVASEIVRLGIGRAREFRFKSERGIQTYLSLMIYFGSEFHRDPQYVWLHALLGDAPSSDEQARVDRIIKATGDYSAAVAGPNHEHIDKALTTLLDRGPAIITDPQRSTLPSIRLLLHEIYPEKAAHLGEPRLTDLIQNAHSVSGRYELAGNGPVVLFSLLKLLLGTFADEDSQFGWIAESLSESRGQPEARRLDMLIARCFERLAAWTSAG